MLTKEQIDYLFVFCSRHGVDYYEVQTELVDHLGSEIEGEMATNPDTNFSSALTRAFATFGRYGFEEIVEERRAMISKRISKEYWEDIRNQFKWPQVLTYILSSTLFFSIFLTNNKVGLCIAFLTVTFADLSVLYFQYKLTKPLNRSGKRFMSTQYARSRNAAGLLSSLMILFVSLKPYILTKSIEESNWLCFILSLVAGLSIIFALCSLRIMKTTCDKVMNDFPNIFRIA